MSDELRRAADDERVPSDVRALLRVAADDVEWLERWYWLPSSVAAGVLIWAVGVVTWLLW